MKVYRLYTTCPYYGEVSEEGIFSTPQKIKEAKEIIVRNIGIEDYDERFSVDEVELDKMPYDRQREGYENNKRGV